MPTRALAILILCCLAWSPQILAQSKQIFVVPDSGDIRVYSEDLQTAATLANPGGEMVDVFGTPDGSRYVLVSKSGTNTVTIVRTPIGSIVPQTLSYGAGADAAVMTRDGGLLIIATTTLRVIDLANAAEVFISNLSGNIAVKDLALSPDSRYVYALSSGSGTLVQVDLITRSAVRTVQVDSTATNVSCSLAGHVYVSGPNSILELDGRTLAQRFQWSFSGLSPSKIQFTPDLKYGLTINRSGVVAAVMLLNLTERRMTGTFPIQGVFGDVAPMTKVTVVDNARAIAYSRDLGKAYDLRFPEPTTWSEFNVASGSPVYGIAFSDETPNLRSAWLATGAEIRRINIGSSSVANSLVLNSRSTIFRAGRGTAGTPVDIQLINNGVTVTPGGQLLATARAVDSNGAPLMGVTIIFSSTVPGLEILTLTQVATSADGYATALITAPQAAGTHSLNIGTNVGLSRSFQIVVASGSGGTGGGTGGGGGTTVGTARAIKVAGDGQILRVSIQPSSEVVVRLLGSDNKPLADKPVTWSGSFDLAFMSPTNTITNAAGEARVSYLLTGLVQQGNNFNQYQITAQSEVGNVAFSAIGIDSLTADPYIQLTKPSDVERRIVVKAGEKLVDAINAYVGAGSAGVPIPNVGMYLTTGNDPERAPTASCENGAALSNEGGFISCNVIAGPIVGSTQAMVSIGSVRNFVVQLTVDPGSPAGVNILGGSDQETLFNQDYPRVLVAKVVDKAGNGLRDVPVLWTAVQSGGVTLISSESRTDSNGEARARVRGGSQAGTFQVRIQSGDFSANFNLRVVVPLGSLAKVSGDNQPTVVAGREFADPLIVQVVNAAGAPAAGVNVAWEIMSGSAQLSAPNTLTDVDGRARIRVTAGLIPGSISIRASVVTLTPVTFTLNSRPAGPEGLAVRTLNTFYPGLTSGGWAVITGRSLTTNLTGTQYANLLAPNLPMTLAGVKIEFGGSGLSAPLYSVSNVNNQESVVFLVPWELGEGIASITVRAGDGSAILSNIPVRRHNPALLETTDIAGRVVPFMQRSDGTLITPANPARRGEQVLVYAINLGQTTPLARTNVLGGVDQKIEAASAIGIGSIALYGADVSIVLSPQFMGIYEVTFKIPDNAEIGSFVPFGLQIVPPGSTPLFTQDSTIAIANR